MKTKVSKDGEKIKIKKISEMVGNRQSKHNDVIVTK